MIKRFFLIAILFIAAHSISFADSIAINHFMIKENPFGKDEVAVIAVDTAQNTLDNVNGTFNFVVDGFQTDLIFDKGVAFYHHKLDKSAFLYIKHTNDSGTHSMLYYIYKHDSKLDPFHISVLLLLAIPLLLVLLGYMFKRFIIIAIVIFCIFLYFNHHNGLSMPTFFESIFDGLKSIF